MTALILSTENLHTVKHALRKACPKARSSHLSEAIAAAVGRRTHAALLVDLAHANAADPEVRLIDQDAFAARLKELGSDLSCEDIDWDNFQPDMLCQDEVVISTTPRIGSEIRYTSLRDRAWRNMMVAAINAGIEQRFFSVRRGDNRWPLSENRQTHVFAFEFGDGVPALCSLCDAGWDEISIHVALWPTIRGVELVGAAGAGFYAGEAFASGWLERKSGAWLQSSTETLKCRRKLLRAVADVNVKPIGFGDHGQLIL